MISRQSKIKRAKQVMGFITSHIALNGEAPTLAEIAGFLGFRSPASVHDILIAMENRGLIERTRAWRGITVIKTI